MTNPLQGIAEEIRTPSLGQNLQYAQLRQGTVTAVNLGANTCSINLSGDTATTVDNVPCLDSYIPAVSDNVYLLKSGSDLVAMGTLDVPVPAISPSNTVSTQIFPEQGSAAGSAVTYSRGDHAHGTPGYGRGGHMNQALTGNTVYNGGSFASVGNGASFSYTKQYSSTVTNLLCTMSATFFISGGTISGTGAQFGVNIDSTDTQVCQFVVNDGTRNIAAGSRILVGVAAGTYTVNMRLRKTGGGTSINMNSGDDYVTMTLVEIGA